MPQTPEDFARSKINAACYAACKESDIASSMYQDDPCVSGLKQSFISHFGHLIKIGRSPEQARDEMLQKLDLMGRDSFLAASLKKRSDPTITPLGDGEPSRHGAESMNIHDGYGWATISRDQLVAFVKKVGEELDKDFLYSDAETFDDATEKMGKDVARHFNLQGK
jgi:hypothetical protein